MKVSILVFSPSGHTLRVAQLFKKEFEDRDIKVQLIDITRNQEYLNCNKIKDVLEKNLEEHNVLLIGSPVYAGHTESNILNIISNLPEPGRKHGFLAVPFITYGGVHSSIALEEMGKYISKNKRKSILGVKIAATHTLSQSFSNVINAQKPGIFEEKLISESVTKIIAVANQDYKKIIDVRKTFAYSKLMERILFKLLSQNFFHKKYKTVSIDANKCIKCYKCKSVCPVNMFSHSDSEIYIERDNSKCILCGECYHHCPTGAINYQYINKVRKRLKNGYANLEKEQSAIYPKKRSQQKLLNLN